MSEYCRLVSAKAVLCSENSITFDSNGLLCRLKVTGTDTSVLLDGDRSTIGMLATLNEGETLEFMGKVTLYNIKGGEMEVRFLLYDKA